MKNAEYGSNVVIGLVDSGIWPERPSYRDHGLKPMPIHWKGEFLGGNNFPKRNKKLVGAKYFSKGVSPRAVEASTRDTYGNGTHTSSIASGSHVRNASTFGYAPGDAYGNEGPFPHFVTNIPPWVTTVGAGAMDRRFPVQLMLGDGSIFASESTYSGTSLAQTKLFPIVYVGNASLKENPRATIIKHGTKLNVRPAPLVATFSSRGPNPKSIYIMKPDLLAPGVNILAAWPDGTGPTQQPFDTRRVEFSILSSTSMSCPHVSGIAALLKGVHPHWSPAIIKSALMTTAYELTMQGISWLTKVQTMHLRHGTMAQDTWILKERLILDSYTTFRLRITWIFYALPTTMKKIKIDNLTATQVSEGASNYTLNIENSTGVVMTATSAGAISGPHLEKPPHRLLRNTFQMKPSTSTLLDYPANRYHVPNNHLVDRRRLAGPSGYERGYGQVQNYFHGNFSNREVQLGKAKKVVSAQNLWKIETGTPYMLFKDACNRKSNQQNLVCNLASIALLRYVRKKDVPIESHPSMLVGSSGSKNRYFDFDKLVEVTALVTTNLNKIIDVNYYPVDTAKTSNLRHRPIGLGVQGLADAFILLGMPFDSPEVANHMCLLSLQFDFFPLEGLKKSNCSEESPSSLAESKHN
ncbi:hypothetical protein IFM89_027514 [Coptis chinensis]|uniref:Peptidase S8/S53 domain-containing protein n=1 Tax=Coptis chinensis TaxID=261450 RepID=A0A835LXH7_9MAGN|nr:hypothetical protein IFM89_027514 [Coptis chinensis]